ncbi:nucleotide exchange factor GrpE [Helicobacter sp. MIT 05-5294]|uniref:nucleotide exchange factor GrpE n=1 Tax=Helicobacter sp. MIT 05-5294 TaxID=1548150 RepID=UPI00051FEB0A|nr:nucleotide exchange factor GrpE [Helicobacter sp. MIT 05-5294]TLD87882.1 nucleotide exchange factor GrpE [Helicobacter sp. MIT 05-5294]
MQEKTEVEPNENETFDDSQEDLEKNSESQEERMEESDCKEALQAQIGELKDQYMRAYADFENTKKRLIRDKDQALEYAYEKIAKDLLPSLDTLEIALKTIRDSKEASENQGEILGKIEEGIALTLDNLLKTLAKHGIEPILTEGGFDPNFHDAIMQVQSDTHESGEIVAEMQKGYKYKERVLRPSMVSIAK